MDTKPIRRLLFSVVLMLFALLIFGIGAIATLQPIQTSTSILLSEACPALALFAAGIAIILGLTALS